MATLTPIVENFQLVTPLQRFERHPQGDSVSPKDMVFHTMADPSQPVQVLDIGFGTGTLGRLIRGDARTAHWAVDGIDGWDVNCHNEELIQAQVYRNLWHGLAQDLPAERVAQYDLLCLLDVIEHLDADTARGLLRWLLTHMGDNARLFISTPLWFYPQDQIQDGDLEAHLIGVPATSMFALLPTMYAISSPLIGGFLLTKRSLANVDFFHPTADRDFTIERGRSLLEMMRLPHNEGVLYLT